MVGRCSARRHLGRRAIGIEPAIGGAPVAVHAHELGDAWALESFLKHGGVRSRPFGGLRFVGLPAHRHVLHRIENRLDLAQPGWHPLPPVHDFIVADPSIPLYPSPSPDRPSRPDARWP